MIGYNVYILHILYHDQMGLLRKESIEAVLYCKKKTGKILGILTLSLYLFSFHLIIITELLMYAAILVFYVWTKITISLRHGNVSWQH
jgi:ADP-heptose:LPS heptosyltransferase